MSFDEVTPALCSLASAPDQGSIAVQLHLSYITQALHAEEVNEQRKEVHAVDMYTPPTQGKQHY